MVNANTSLAGARVSGLACHHDAVSWSMFVVPLHQIDHQELVDWSFDVSFAFGIPREPALPRSLPLVVDVLDAFARGGCHGTAWFEVEGLDLAATLPSCTGLAECAAAGWLDLGEVTLREPGAESDLGEPVPAGDDGKPALLDPESRVGSIAFRKPNPVAVLRAVTMLVGTAGPILVFDDLADRVFVVAPGDTYEGLAKFWPW
jgi:hypothetical protein